MALTFPTTQPVVTVNQQQLAKQLKLSHTTVSRSLTNHPAISEETRKRVQALAAKMGYRKAPTRTIRRTRLAKPLSIGVLIGSPLASTDRSTFPLILQGIRERAAIEHASVDVVPIDTAALAGLNGQRQIFRHIRRADWRGAVLIYPFAPSMIEMLSHKLCVVSVLTEYHDASIDVIDTDHDGVRYLVTRLAALGHRKIGFMSWHYPAGGLWASRRFAAYAEGLFQHGLTLRKEWVINLHAGSPRFESHQDIADEVVRRIRKDHVTAWVCAADHQAYRLISDLQARGLKIPRDCSITGFDGNDTPPGLPALATMGVPNEDIGASAVARLISRLLNPASALRKNLVATSFIPGETLAPPPAS
ncbi:MAG: LacI family DNA-binding transcriptional regulator [Opitutaceae bacterium]